MYYLIYYPLYLVSLLPLRILYLFADILYGFVYYISGYRKKVVLSNLQIAFPEKSARERTRIAKDFYHNFIDTFVETIKFLSWNLGDVKKRFEADLSGMEEAFASGKSIHLVGMHNFNWEFANWGMAQSVRYPFLGIYMPVGNKAFDRVMYNLRSRYGTILLPATDFKKHYLSYINTKHVLGTVADQSPGNPNNAYWLYFFGRPTAFVTGPEKGARLNDSAIVFAHFYKVKRGHYRVDTRFFTANPNDCKPGEITRSYARFVEECLRRHPANYLWSHRRWKKEWKPEYKALWIDVAPPPED